jgi:DNA-binding NarL/FixJ family response regulator
MLMLMLTMFEDDCSALAAMRAGARGYVLKAAEQDQIVRTIHAVPQAKPSSGRHLPAGPRHGGRPTADAATIPELTRPGARGTRPDRRRNE